MISLLQKKKDLLLYLGILFGIVFLFYLGNKSLGYVWQLEEIPKFFFSNTAEGWQAGVLLKGLRLTLIISVISLVLAIFLGFLSAFFALSNSISGVFFSKVYVELIRNTPILIQLFIFYYIFAPLLGLDRFWAGVLCLSFFEGAYSSEIIRGGIQAIKKGQWEAARSLGLNTKITFLKVILPQAIKIIIPPLTSQLLSLIKNSSIVSVIAILDLVAVGRNLIADTFLVFEVWFTIAIIYFIINFILTFFIRYIEKKYFYSPT